MPLTVDTIIAGGEQVVLDPSEVATGRVEVDITGLVNRDGVDWGDAAVEQHMAEAERGQVPVDSRTPNRTVTIPLLIQDRDLDVFEGLRQDIQAKCALFQQEGGWIKRQTAIGPVYADVVSATLKLGGSSAQALWGIDADAVLTLECTPDWYGDAVTLADHVETAAPELVFVEDAFPGNYPARVELLVDDDQGQTRRSLIWGFRSRYYDGSPTARLVYEAEALTPIDTAAVASLSGAVGGSAIRLGSLATVWLPVLSTDLGVDSLTHVGSYRVWARVYSPDGPAVRVRFVWDVGDLTLPAENAAQTVPAASEFHLFDLGEIRLDRVAAGAHRWRGIVQAIGTNFGESIYIDRLYFQPLDESAGKLVAPPGSVEGITGSGARSPATLASTGGGSNAWSNPGNAAASDNTYATCSIVTGTQYLKATDFGFGIPAGATIDGIEVEIERASTTVSGSTARDSEVRIVKGGTIQTAVNRAATGVYWPSSDAYRTYGSPSDLWGTTWTPTNINASGFGVALAALPSSGATPVARVDHIRITIHYSFAPTGSADAVIYGSQSCALRTDGCFRQASADDHYGPVSQVIGDLPRFPVGGIEGRPVEVFVLASRSDLGSVPDDGIDDVSAQASARPCWAYVPDS